MRQSKLKNLEMNDKITFNFCGEEYTSIVNYISYNKRKMEIMTGIIENGCCFDLCLHPSDIISFEHTEDKDNV